MQVEEFNKLLEMRISTIRQQLAAKRSEYVTVDDMLDNFKLSAALQKTSVRRALLGMFSKHLSAIVANIDLRKDRSFWSEKIGDAVNYLILLEAIIVEEYESYCATIRADGDTCDKDRALRACELLLTGQCTDVEGCLAKVRSALGSEHMENI